MTAVTVAGGPAAVVRAMHRVRTGAVYELGTELGNEMPAVPRASFHPFEVLQYRLPKSLVSRESPGFDYSMDVLVGSPHVGTHIDGLAHINCHGRLFGGASVRDTYADSGWTENGMERSAPFIGRGILLDVPAVLGAACLPDRHEIGVDELSRALDAHGVSIEPGDAVLVRTGWFAAHYRAAPERYFASQPGVGPDAAVWLYERGMRLLGTDTSGTEVIPMPDLERTTHRELLVERGVHLLEILDLEALAAAAVHEFTLLVLPLRITGATGSWIRPIAIA